MLTNESAQNIALEFFPTADVIIRIRDTSTGSQGSNRDAAVRDMQLVASCEGRSLSADENASAPSGQTISINTAYPTGRTIGGKAEFECLYQYTLFNHTASTSITVPAPVSGFTSMGAILAADGGADNGTIFQGIEDASGDISADDLLFDRSTGSFTHTYEGNWSGYTMRLNVRYLEA